MYLCQYIYYRVLNIDVFCLLFCYEENNFLIFNIMMFIFVSILYKIYVIVLFFFVFGYMKDVEYLVGIIKQFFVMILIKIGDEFILGYD